MAMTIPRQDQTVHLMTWCDVLRVRRCIEGRNKLELQLYTTDDLRRRYQENGDGLIRLRDGIVTRQELVAEIRWRVFWEEFGYAVMLIMTVIAAVASVVAAIFAARANAAQPHLDSKLREFLQGYVRSSPLALDKTLRASVAMVDLRGDGAKEALVYLSGRDWCGSGGCPLLVVVPDGSSFKVISKTTITRPPVRILSTRSHGWSDLGVTVVGGGTSRAYLVKLPFNGSGYAENPTSPPAGPTSGAEGTIAISTSDRGQALFP